MLPERITQLLSAYVDGELSHRERKSVTRMLRKSSEARKLLDKMKQDSMVLRRLPRKKTQMDLSGSVMGTISLRGIKLPKIEPSPLPPLKIAGSRRFPSWLGVAIAAGILVAVGFGSYFLFSNAFQNTPITKKGEVDPGTKGRGELPGPDKSQSANESQPEDPPPAITVVHEVDPMGTTGPEVPPKAIPGPKEKPLARLAPKLPSFVTAHPRLMLLLAMRDIDQPASAQQLLQELKKDNASRIDLFCSSDTAKAFDRLQGAFKANGVTLRIDPNAQVRLNQRLPTNFAIYSEELSPEDLTKILQQLALEDKKPTGGALFNKVAINPLTAAEMAKTLGGDAGLYQQPEYKGPLGLDVHQEVSEKTGNQIVQSLSGPARTDVPNPGKGGSRVAVLVPYNLAPASFSREIKYLVENRKEWRSGAIQVLLVLWNNG